MGVKFCHFIISIKFLARLLPAVPTPRFVPFRHSGTTRCTGQANLRHAPFRHLARQNPRLIPFSRACSTLQQSAGQSVLTWFKPQKRTRHSGGPRLVLARSDQLANLGNCCNCSLVIDRQTRTSTTPGDRITSRPIQSLISGPPITMTQHHKPKGTSWRLL